MNKMLQRLKRYQQLEVTRQQLEEVKLCSDIEIRTNAVPIVLSDIFEYTFSFKPLIADKFQLTFLKRFFATFVQMIVYYNNSILTTKKLEEDKLEWTLLNKTLQTNVTVTLVFVRKHEGNLDLFKKIMDYKCQSLVALFDGKGLKYVYSLHSVENNLLLCIDCEHYAIEDQTLKEVSQFYEKVYGKNRYQDVLNFFLQKSFIVHSRDNTVYKYQRIDWSDDTIVLKNRVQYVIANMDQCYITKRVDFEANESTSVLRSHVETLLKQLQSDLSLVNVNAYTLSNETVIFGDKVTCRRHEWSDDLRNNEFFTSVELWCWVIIHHVDDENAAKTFASDVQNLQDTVGMRIGQPLYFRIIGDNKSDYMYALKSVASKDLQLVTVILRESKNKPEALIKYINCVKHPVPTRILYSHDIKGKAHEFVLSINAVIGGSLWYVTLPEKIMICAIDTYLGFDQKLPPVCSSVTNLASDGIQWYSKINFLKDDSIQNKVDDAAHKFFEINGEYPEQIVIYHTSTESLLDTVIKYYNDLNVSFKLTVVLVSNDVKLWCFDKNVPPGTVIRDKIVESCDFFLFSNARGGVCRPIHYAVIKNGANIALNVLERLTYKLCHLYYKRANVNSNNGAMNNEVERTQRIEAALEKLRASELNHRTIVRRYLNLEAAVNKQLKNEDAEVSRQTKSRFALKQSSSSFSGTSATTTGSQKSKRENKQHELLQKRICLFHNELDAINEMNSKKNSKKKMFLNALEKTNMDVWDSDAIKYSVRKLENHMT
ncbi:hypothetical protein FQR65_LT02191 [Abscondita terminalis]|nr:hypothetical protein FQR65_LT02191 [Abscondita terminalis]